MYEYEYTRMYIVYSYEYVHAHTCCTELECIEQYNNTFTGSLFGYKISFVFLNLSTHSFAKHLKTFEIVLKTIENI